MTVPRLPYAWAPNLNRWARCIRLVVDKPDEQLHLIGHSTGSLAILRYLEGLQGCERVGTVVLVSAFPQALFHPRLPNILARAPRPKLLRGRYSRLLAVHTETDRRVPLSNGRWLVQQLDATMVNLGARGHMDARAGVTDWPPELYQRVFNELP